jgi:hypothetical protein
LTLLMGLCCFWFVPCFTNMLVKTLSHCTSPTPWSSLATCHPYLKTATRNCDPLRGIHS